MILGQTPFLKSRDLKAIGFWKSHQQPNYPDPNDFVDHDWNEEERQKVIRYLDNGKTIARFRGFSLCRICGAPNGSKTVGDGAYIWPSGFSHYLIQHGVRPPQEFVDHVMGKLKPKPSGPLTPIELPGGSRSSYCARGNKEDV